MAFFIPYHLTYREHLGIIACGGYYAFQVGRRSWLALALEATH